MARVTWTFLAAGLLLAGCGRFTAQSEPADDPEIQGLAYGDYVIGEPIRYQNLTVFPVSSSEPKADDRFITLDEGLKAGTVEIRELGSAGANSPPDAPANPVSNAASPPPPPQPPPGATQSRAANAPGQSASNQSPAAQQPAAQSLEQGDDQGFGGVGQRAGISRSGGNGASVNEVLVVNRSSKPLYLTPGDVMIGGQQDRVIGQEFVVDATGKPTTVPVFCVEHGRWASRDVGQNANYLANVQARDREKLSAEELKKLAEDANSGKFVKGAGVVTKDVRLAVQGAMDQGKVWEEVGKANSKNGAQSGSGAFTANFGEKELTEKLDPYLDNLQKPMEESRNVIGVIVAINGKPHSIDVFESTPLFQKLWPKLLKSYALDALGNVPEAEAEKTCDAAAAVEFLKQASEAKVASQDEKAGVSLTHRENDAVACFTVCKPILSVGGEAAPAKAAPIHLNALSK